MGPSDRRSWRAGWALALGLLSPLLPLGALLGLREPLGVGFDDPARIAYYRLVSLALTLGIAAGIAALWLARAGSPAWLRRLGAALGAVGLVGSALLLLTEVGLCGAPVLWGYCNP